MSNDSKGIVFSNLYYLQICFLCRLKKSKQTFNTNFVIWRPVKMTWSAYNRQRQQLCRQYPIINNLVLHKDVIIIPVWIVWLYCKFSSLVLWYVSASISWLDSWWTFGKTYSTSKKPKYCFEVTYFQWSHIDFKLLQTGFVSRLVLVSPLFTVFTSIPDCRVQTFKTSQLSDSALQPAGTVHKRAGTTKLWCLSECSPRCVE